jgi:hypothetical protein
VPEELEMLVDLLIQTVNGCMLTQQAVELDHQKTLGYSGMNGNILSAMGSTNIKAHPSAKPKQNTMIVGASTAMGGSAGGALATSKLVQVGRK